MTTVKGKNAPALAFGVRPAATFCSRPLAKPLDLGLDTEGLYPFQVHGTRRLLTERDWLLGDEQRLGKTVQTLRAVRRPTIILCPNSLRRAWLRECRRWRPDLRPRLAKPGLVAHPGRGGVLIVGHDAMPAPLRPDRLILADLSDVQLVVDEVQRFKSADALRTVAERALAAQVYGVWSLTGTPMLGSPDDLYGVLKSGRLLERSFGDAERFRAAFGGTPGEFGTNWPERPPHPRLVTEALRRVMLRRERRDVLPDLPKKTYEVFECDVPDDLLDELRAADEEWERIGLDQLPPFTMLQALRTALARSRIPALLEYADENSSGEDPLLVFGAHVDPLLALGELEGWASMTGADGERDRDELVQAFQAGELRGLALSITVGGVGLTLPRAQHCAFSSLSYTPGENEQAEDRMVHVDSKASRILVTTFVTDHAVERRLHEILGVKRTRIKATVSAARERHSR